MVWVRKFFKLFGSFRNTFNPELKTTSLNSYHQQRPAWWGSVIIFYHYHHRTTTTCQQQNIFGSRGVVVVQKFNCIMLYVNFYSCSLYLSVSPCRPQNQPIITTFIKHTFPQDTFSLFF